MVRKASWSGYEKRRQVKLPKLTMRMFGLLLNLNAYDTYRYVSQHALGLAGLRELIRRPPPPPPPSDHLIPILIG
jgi:hypothetical protein